MSVEDRIRTGLHAAADDWTPAVESSLAVVKARQRRSRRTVAAVAAAALITVAGAAAVLTRFTPTQLTGIPSTSAPAAPSLVGRFEGRVTEPTRLAGRWPLHFRPDGRLDVTAPPGYSGVLSAALFATDGDTLTTTLFQEDVCSGSGVGRYTWQRVASGVRFIGQDDTCAAPGVPDQHHLGVNQVIRSCLSSG